MQEIMEETTLTEKPEPKNSTHKAEVVPIELTPHPNADRLSIVKVFGYTCCVETEAWRNVTKGVYIPPDSIVDTNRPPFAFLADPKKGNEIRVKAKKLRGIVSFGLLIPAPDEATIGDDWADFLGVKHWNPPQEKGGAFMGGQVAEPPSCQFVKYDLDSFRRYADVFEEGEPVVVTEKIHGSSARYVYYDEKMHCGSRSEWKEEYPNISYEFFLERIGDEEKAREAFERTQAKPPKQNLWWQVMRENPCIERFCRAHEGAVLHGEVYGWVQSLRYGHEQGKVSFAAFDVYQDGRNWDTFKFFGVMDQYDVPFVPLLNECSFTGLHCLRMIEPIRFNFDKLCELAEGPSLISGADHYREGIVISPVSERYNPRVGRVKLKLVSATYLEKSK